MKNISVNILDKEKIKKVLKDLGEDAKPQWGNLTAQYMVEHLAATMKYSNGKVVHPLLVPLEHLERYKTVLFEDKEFPKFFKSPVFKKDLPQLNHSNIPDAIEELIEEITIFQTYFKENAGIKVMHAIFGELDFEEWLVYHNKHFQHHFKQFGLM